LWEQGGEINLAGIKLARSAAGQERFAFLDVGPFNEADRRQAAAWAVECASTGGADALLIETSSDISDVAKILKDRARTGHKSKELPVLFSWTISRRANGSVRGQRGESPAALARLARHFDIAALGVNCGRDIGMDENPEAIRQYHAETDLPLFARPNAGTPTRVGVHWVYPLTPERLAERLPELLEAGVNMVGGCCGTTPEHVAAMRPIVEEWNTRHGLTRTCW